MTSRPPFPCLLPGRPSVAGRAVAARLLTPALLTLLLAACGPAAPPADAPADAAAGLADSLAVMDEVGREYVSLVLELGTHDDGYVDAYYGPAEWRQEAEAAPRGVTEIARRAGELAARLNTLHVPGVARDRDEDPAAPPSEPEMAELRRTFLARQLGAVAARARILGGETLSFDEEAKALYDAEPPHYPDEHFAAVVADLDALIPGDGPLAARYRAWRDGFVIPPERLDDVFQAAIAECRRRTAEHLELPAGEGFTVEYVTDKPWSGYNWYQGDYRSLIQVNTDLPIFVDRAVDLACHEGYPGHHVFNLLLEKNMVRDRGWHEFSVYPLYSPQSLLAEGTANYGIRVAFPGDERVRFESEVLFPLAGLDPERAAGYYAVAEKMQDLAYAGNEAARRYLDGEMDADAAVAWLGRYAMSPPERAAQRVSFFDAYRSYVINYNLGQDVVRHWVESRVESRAESQVAAEGGEASRSQRRWQAFSRLLTTPRVPSELVEQSAAPAGG